MESEDERLARVERLAAKNPHHAESGIAVAEQALAAGDPSRAIEALGPQLSGDAVRIEAARLALDAYQRLGMDPPAHAGWIDAAATGAPPPGWRCSACGTGTGTWQSECPHCSRIGRIRPDGI
jgi:HemY protein